MLNIWLYYIKEGVARNQWLSADHYTVSNAKPTLTTAEDPAKT